MVDGFQWGGALCPFRPYFHKAEPCLLSGWPLCVEVGSIGATIGPQILADSTLALKFFLSAVQGLGAILCSNLEEALYKSP